MVLAAWDRDDIRGHRHGRLRCPRNRVHGRTHSTDQMPLLVLLIVALAAGAWSAFSPGTTRRPRPPRRRCRRGEGGRTRDRPPQPTPPALKRRLNPEVATGLALTIALGAVLVGGLALGSAYLVRTSTRSSSTSTPASRNGAPTTRDACHGPRPGSPHASRRDVLRRSRGRGRLGRRYVRRPSRWIPSSSSFSSARTF